MEVSCTLCGFFPPDFKRGKNIQYQIAVYRCICYKCYANVISITKTDKKGTLAPSLQDYQTTYERLINAKFNK